MSTQQEDPDDTDAPAWIDSEDEKIVVSLASNTRLRKLRKTEAEDLVHGKEYIKRLQQQFERLHPRPAWALQAENGNRRKKKRRSSFQEGSGDEIDSDDSIDLEEIDVQPLSKLLRSTDLLTESPSSDSSKRILRAGILDIQRSKDIGGTQPVRRILPIHPSAELINFHSPQYLLSRFIQQNLYFYQPVQVVSSHYSI